MGEIGSTRKLILLPKRTFLQCAQGARLSDPGSAPAHSLVRSGSMTRANGGLTWLSSRKSAPSLSALALGLAATWDTSIDRRSA